jgi:hypothetical protein
MIVFVGESGVKKQHGMRVAQKEAVKNTER